MYLFNTEGHLKIHSVVPLPSFEMSKSRDCSIVSNQQMLFCMINIHFISSPLSLFCLLFSADKCCSTQPIFINFIASYLFLCCFQPTNLVLNNKNSLISLRHACSLCCFQLTNLVLNNKNSLISLCHACSLCCFQPTNAVVHNKNSLISLRHACSLCCFSRQMPFCTSASSRSKERWPPAWPRATVRSSSSCTATTASPTSIALTPTLNTARSLSYT